MTAYRDTLRFDSIVVIESLRPTDMKTGDWLYTSVIEPWARSNAPFYTKLYLPTSRFEFLGVLDELRDQLFRNGHAPILHIEAHGDREGLELGNHEHIPWEALRQRVTEMNQLCQVNLLLVMAMCAGWHLSRLLIPTQRAPVWGIVGPTSDDVTAGDLRNAMEGFYYTLLQTMNARRALDAMNGRVTYEQWTYRLETAEMMFCRAFHNYVSVNGTDDALKERENEIVAEILRHRHHDITVAFDARALAHQMLRDHSTAFAFFRRTFLFIDMFPDNEARFKLNYTDCTTLQSHEQKTT